MLVTQYYKSDPPIVSNNNIWLSASLRFPRLRPYILAILMILRQRGKYSNARQQCPDGGH